LTVGKGDGRGSLIVGKGDGRANLAVGKGAGARGLPGSKEFDGAEFAWGMGTGM